MSVITYYIWSYRNREETNIKQVLSVETNKSPSSVMNYK